MLICESRTVRIKGECKHGHSILPAGLSLAAVCLLSAGADMGKTNLTKFIVSPYSYWPSWVKWQGTPTEAREETQTGNSPGRSCWNSAQHNQEQFSSSLRPASYKLEAWGPDLQPGGNNVNTSQCSSQVSAKYTDIRPIVNHVNLKLKIWVKPINIQFLPSQTSPLKALKPPSVFIHVYLCVTRESAAECDSEAASARLACTNRVHLCSSSSPFLADQREQSSSLQSSRRAVLTLLPQSGLAALRPSSSRSGAGDVSWLLGLWSQNWAPVVVCGALQCHALSYGLPDPLWNHPGSVGTSQGPCQ